MFSRGREKVHCEQIDYYMELYITTDISCEVMLAKIALVFHEGKANQNCKK